MTSQNIGFLFTSQCRAWQLWGDVNWVGFWFSLKFPGSSEIAPEIASSFRAMVDYQRFSFSMQLPQVPSSPLNFGASRGDPRQSASWRIPIFGQAMFPTKVHGSPGVHQKHSIFAKFLSISNGISSYFFKVPQPAKAREVRDSWSSLLHTSTNPWRSVGAKRFCSAARESLGFLGFWVVKSVEYCGTPQFVSQECCQTGCNVPISGFEEQPDLSALGDSRYRSIPAKMLCCNNGDCPNLEWLLYLGPTASTRTFKVMILIFNFDLHCPLPSCVLSNRSCALFHHHRPYRIP